MAHEMFVSHTITFESIYPSLHRTNHSLASYNPLLTMSSFGKRATDFDLKDPALLDLLDQHHEQLRFAKFSPEIGASANKAASTISRISTHPAF